MTKLWKTIAGAAVLVGATTLVTTQVVSQDADPSGDMPPGMQEAMIRIVRNLDRFDGRSAFGTWAYRIATNTALDELRRRRRSRFEAYPIVAHADVNPIPRAVYAYARRISAGMFSDILQQLPNHTKDCRRHFRADRLGV